MSHLPREEAETEQHHQSKPLLQYSVPPVAFSRPFAETEIIREKLQVSYDQRLGLK